MNTLAPCLAFGVVWAGAAIIVLRTAKLHRGALKHQAAHSADTLPNVPYMPAGNPWRIGSTVLVSEDITRPELNWFGTVLSTNRSMITLRDNTAPYQSIELEKAKVFHPDTVFPTPNVLDDMPRHWF